MEHLPLKAARMDVLLLGHTMVLSNLIIDHHMRWLASLHI